jgi:hypothetical protein
MTDNVSTIFLVTTYTFFQSLFFLLTLIIPFKSLPISSYLTLSPLPTFSHHSAEIDVASLNDQIEKIVSAIERMKKDDSTTPEEFSDPKDDQNLD